MHNDFTLSIDNIEPDEILKVFDYYWSELIVSLISEAICVTYMNNDDMVDYFSDSKRSPHSQIRAGLDSLDARYLLARSGGLPLAYAHPRLHAPHISHSSAARSCRASAVASKGANQNILIVKNTSDYEKVPAICLNYF